ncbi:zinc-dependent alcohol dehydrogenase family protein [Sphingomonas endolithica]|uniref:zinc-dependent alcohol dehydrogenase family protein n=1 Tax=Sphingomonas endolithica TaxID=2972485 RepID=UPI0021AF64AE|nr:NAD(P)-dependent alcohol dehydrogenase [Sphingomonas sp. ZFBP2030]
MTDMMRRWEMDGIGRDRLALRERPIPVPARHEVLVKVAAVSLNHRDKMVIESGRGLALDFPFTPGSDLAGRIVATGDNVKRFAVGDRVISCFTPEWIDGARAGTARTPAYRTLGGFFAGVLAEYVVLPEEWLAAAPAKLDDAEASTLPCAALTAWFALVERGGVRAGDTVLIRGTGGVALFGLQIAKLHGATVLVSCSPEKIDRVLALGADHAIDRYDTHGLEALYTLTYDRGADHILETVGGAYLGQSVQAAAVGGRIYQIGALDGFDITSPAMPLMIKDVTILGIGTGNRRALEDMVRAVARTGMTPVIDRRFPLADLPNALDRLGAGRSARA